MGTNGAGKTSALLLIPVFYGREPERLIVRTAERVSFIDYYLPTNQSMVVFEYTRSTGPCCVALYRRTNGAHAYRFIKGAAEETLFTPEMIEAIDAGVSARELFSHPAAQFKKSRQIDQIIDYRSILENNHQQLVRKKGKSHFKSEAYDYCLGSHSTQSKHLGALTSITLENKKVLASFKQMVIDAFLQELTINALPKHNKDHELLSDISGLQDFDEHDKDIQSCLETSAELEVTWKEMNAYHRSLSKIVQSKIETLKEMATVQSEITTDLEDQERTYLESRSILVGNRSDARAEKNSADNSINRLHVEKEEWDQQDIDLKLANQALLPQRKQQLRDEKEHFEKLNDESAQREDEFKARELEKKQKTQNLLSDLDKKSAKTIKSFNHKKDKKSEVEQVSLKRLAEDKDNLQTAHDKRIEPLDLKLLKQTKVAASSDRLADEKADALSAKEGVINAEKVLGDEEAALLTATEALKNSTKARDEGLRKYELLKMERKQADEREQKVRAQLYPADGSLLSYLREEMPNWVETIGKTINPDLLVCKTLAPNHNQNDSFYGLKLDLQQLDTCSEAKNQEQLLEDHKQAENIFKQADSNYEAAEEQQKKFSTQVSNDSRLEREQGVSARIAGDAHEQAINTENSISRKIQTKIEQRRQQAEKNIEKTRADIAAAKTSLKEEKKELEYLHNELMQENMSSWSFIESEHATSIDLIELEKKQFTKALKSALKELKVAYIASCKKEGVDDETLFSAKSRVENLEKQIEQIYQDEETIIKYQRWVNTSWKNLDELQKQEAAQKRILITVEGQITALKVAYETATSLQNDRQIQLTIKVKDLSDEVNQGATLCQRTQEILKISEFEDLDVDITLYDNLYESLLAFVRKEEELRKDVLKKIRLVKSVVNKYERSNIGKAWGALVDKLGERSRFREGTPEFDLECASLLQDLSNDVIPSIRDTLVQNIQAVGQGINSYYENLSQINQKVARVSSTLEKSINADHSFEVVRDVKVKLNSKVKDDDSWQPLLAFNKEWEKWSGEGAKKIPNEQFIDALRIARDTLDMVRITPSIESFIDLEISMIENNNRTVSIKTDADLTGVSSEGISYIAVLVVFVGITRHLCQDLEVSITWPVDELGKLHPENIAKLFEMMERHNIHLFCAQPDASASLLRQFKWRYLFKKGEGVAIMRAVDDSSKNPLLKDLIAREEVFSA